MHTLPQEQQHLGGAWTCKLAGVLTHVVRDVHCGGRLLVAAMARVASDLKQVRELWGHRPEASRHVSTSDCALAATQLVAAGSFRLLYN